MLWVCPPGEAAHVAAALKRLLARCPGLGDGTVCRPRQRSAGSMVRICSFPPQHAPRFSEQSCGSAFGCAQSDTRDSARFLPFVPGPLFCVSSVSRRGLPEALRPAGSRTGRCPAAWCRVAVAECVLRGPRAMAARGSAGGAPPRVSGGCAVTPGGAATARVPALGAAEGVPAGPLGRGLPPQPGRPWCPPPSPVRVTCSDDPDPSRSPGLPPRLRPRAAQGLRQPLPRATAPVARAWRGSAWMKRGD